MCGSSSHSRPSTTLTCTSSIREWHRMHIPAMLSRLIEDKGLLWSRMLCAVWHEVQTAVTVRPFLKRASPCTDIEKFSRMRSCGMSCCSDTSVPSRWQRPQSSGTLTTWVREL